MLQRQLHFRVCSPSTPTAVEMQQQQQNTDSRENSYRTRLYFKGLPKEINRAMIEAYFKRYGTIIKIKKGFGSAIIDFVDPRDARMARDYEDGQKAPWGEKYRFHILLQDPRDYFRDHKRTHQHRDYHNHKDVDSFDDYDNKEERSGYTKYDSSSLSESSPGLQGAIDNFKAAMTTTSSTSDTTTAAATATPSVHGTDPSPVSYQQVYTLPSRVGQPLVAPLVAAIAETSSAPLVQPIIDFPNAAQRQLQNGGLIAPNSISPYMMDYFAINIRLVALIVALPAADQEEIKTCLVEILWGQSSLYTLVKRLEPKHPQLASLVEQSVKEGQAIFIRQLGLSVATTALSQLSPQQYGNPLK